MSQIISTLRGNFSPLRNQNFRTYLGGQAISLIGSWMQVTAQGWVVWTLTGSATALGTVNMLATLPLLLLGPWAGVWADRLDRRRVLIWTQAGLMGLAFILSALTLTNTVQIWHVYVLSLMTGVLTALDMPAQQAFLGDLAGISEVRKAVNLNVTVLQVSRILGPALAGFVVGAIGAGPAFFVNGLSFVAVIVSLTLVRATQVRSAATSASSSALGSFFESLRHLLSHRRMVDLVIFTALTTFFGLGIIMNLLPAIADRVLGGGADTLGWLMAASGAGALVGVTFVAPLVQAVRRTGLALAGLLIWMGFWFIPFSMSTSLLPAMITMFLVSVAPPSIITTCNGLIQVMSPQGMRARLMSLFVMVSFGMQPLAAIMIGFFADHYGIITATEVYAVALIIGAVIMALRPALRRWDVPARPSTSPAGHT